MKRIIALALVLFTLAAGISAGVFALGYRCCYLRVLRKAEFYVDRDMVVVVLDDDYNETFLAGQWPEDYHGCP